MEKRTPHCALAVIRALMEQGRVRATYSSLAGGAALGLNLDAMIDVVRGLLPHDFYKSMTTHADHRVWQVCIVPLPRWATFM